MDKSGFEQNEPNTQEPVEKPSYVYFLECSDGSTYIGATVDVDRRLRQHNKEISGGAYKTGSKVKKGGIWERICYVANFPTWNAALQFEWRWKQISRRLAANLAPRERRLIALKNLLLLDRPTSKAVAYVEWLTPPEIIWNDEIAKMIYEML
jgi:structure-specific endonuclease subunit SLX1